MKRCCAGVRWRGAITSARRAILSRRKTVYVFPSGNAGMLEELHAMFSGRGFVEGNHSEPGHFVIEKAFVER